MKQLRLALLFILVPLAAWADGAFPDSLGIYLPAGDTEHIRVFTNFGVLTSEDGGAQWRYVCEEAIGYLPRMYQGGPPPAHTMFAMVSDEGLALSKDGACTWSRAKGPLAQAYVPDAFPDPTQPSRVLAVARPRSADGSPARMVLYESLDGGETFERLLFEAPHATDINGVEISRTAPATVYLTLYQTISPKRALLARTTNGGASWDMVDLSEHVGESVAFLAAVDPVDAGKLFLRVLEWDEGKDALAVVKGGGAEVAVELELETKMTAFLRRADGAVIVGTSQPRAFVSRDGGDTFSPWENAPRFRALGERAGKLYAVADHVLDPFAVGVSTDDGKTWRSLLRFDELCGPKLCGDIENACAGAWQKVMATFGVPEGRCEPEKAAPKPGTKPREVSTEQTPTRKRQACATGPGLGLLALILALATGMRGRGARP